LDDEDVGRGPGEDHLLGGPALGGAHGRPRSCEEGAFRVEMRKSRVSDEDVRHGMKT
jgi:hypothetical protein